MKSLTTFAMLFVAGSLSFAQTVSTTKAPANENSDSSVRAASATTTSTTSAEVKPENSSDTVKPSFGIKSFSDFARIENRNAGTTSPTGGQILNAKLDLYVGYVGKAGWGAMFDFAQYRQEFNDSNLDKWVAGDPYITLLHPDFYNNDTLRLYGFFRTYIPYTTSSKKLDYHHHAYFIEASYEMGGERVLENELVPRAFLANKYAPTDSNFYVEDTITFTQRLGKWARVGAGNWFQMEQHKKTATGYTSELFPYFDYILGKSSYIGTKVFLPIFAQNVVWDGPTKATTNQARLELYFQAGL